MACLSIPTRRQAPGRLPRPTNTRYALTSSERSRVDTEPKERRTAAKIASAPSSEIPCASLSRSREAGVQQPGPEATRPASATRKAASARARSAIFRPDSGPTTAVTTPASPASGLTRATISSSPSASELSAVRCVTGWRHCVTSSVPGSALTSRRATRSVSVGSGRPTRGAAATTHLGSRQARAGAAQDSTAQSPSMARNMSSTIRRRSTATSRCVADSFRARERRFDTASSHACRWVM